VVCKPRAEGAVELVTASAAASSTQKVPKAAGNRTHGNRTTTANSKKRKGSFLVIGDWGFDTDVHGTFKNNSCQQLIADQMLKTFKELGDVKFIINVGDSFYPKGVVDKDDPQWDTKWRWIYAPELRSVPWYSVYGNHDYQGDPCACTQDPTECGQVNYDPTDLEHFYMPGLNWYKEHPELDLEVVALDLNHYMWGWNTSWADTLKNYTEGKNVTELPVPDDCGYTECEEECYGNLKWRANEGLDLLHERMNSSKAKNMLVFSHYPTDYLWSETEFLGKLSDASKHHVEYFGGHRHSVDQGSTWNISPNNNWLVGGGGGWGCEGGYYMWPPRQGFVVGKIDSIGDISTHGVFVDHTICCPDTGKPDFEPMFQY